MNNNHSTPLVVARTLRILANELLLLAESISTPGNPDMLASILRDLSEICRSIKRCADELEVGHA